MQSVIIEPQQGRRYLRRGVDEGAVRGTRGLVVDERGDQAEHRLAQRLSALECLFGDRRCGVENARLLDPVRQILLGLQFLVVARASLRDGRQEVEHRPVGDELKIHITSLTGDGWDMQCSQHHHFRG